MRVQVDWGDGGAFGVPVDHTFSIWNSDNFEGIATSQDVGVPQYDWQGVTLPLSFRISAGGKYVLAGASIYELP